MLRCAVRNIKDSMIVIMPGDFSESEVELQIVLVVQAANSIFQPNAKCQVPSAKPELYTSAAEVFHGRYPEVCPSDSFSFFAAAPNPYRQYLNYSIGNLIIKRC